MFLRNTIIRLKDTDATGVLYFAEQLKLSLETFEEYLRTSGFSLGDILQKSHFLMPIVHVESDYFAPLHVDDEIEIALEVERIGTSSFTLKYQIEDPKSKTQVGSASIVHVTVSKETRKTIPIPDVLKNLLNKLQLPSQALCERS